jgi:hypothetical protein
MNRFDCSGSSGVEGLRGMLANISQFTIIVYYGAF